MAGKSGHTPKVFPDWIPTATQRYLRHVSRGESLRALARQENVAPSTILRQIRRIEASREDPLRDAALDRLERQPAKIGSNGETANMSIHPRALALPDQATIEREARRILRRLCESDAVMIAAAHLDKAAVVRLKDGVPVRTATLARDVAQAFALKDWVVCRQKGRVHQYQITSVGRAALKRLLGAPDAAEDSEAYCDQHRDWGERAVQAEDGVQRLRVNLAESPLLQLSRRRDKAGRPFLSEGLVAAGERLREDFELAQMGPRVTQNWDRFMTAGGRGEFGRSDGPAEGPSAARARVQAALADLGPGLGDVVLRCCCHLEGLEAAERRMGWSARSGKIVLRIALQRLAAHYDRVHGQPGAMIG